MAFITCKFCSRKGHAELDCKLKKNQCLICDQFGHEEKKCPKLTCKFCSEKGHAEKDCKLKQTVASLPGNTKDGANKEMSVKCKTYIGKLRWYSRAKENGVIECVESGKEKKCYVHASDVNGDIETGDYVKFRLGHDSQYEEAAKNVTLL